MRAGAASAVGARPHNENGVTTTIAGLWRYGDWRHVATGCTALVLKIDVKKLQFIHSVNGDGSKAAKKQKGNINHTNVT